MESAENRLDRSPGVPSAPDVDTGEFAHPKRPTSWRGEGDPCIGCSICDSVCPVVSVDGDFPGPKFQGPVQWRLRDGEVEIDPSIDACSNCLRCHAACPADVPLDRLHTFTRAVGASGHTPDLDSIAGTSGEKSLRRRLRNRLLASYGWLARLGSRVPRLTNLVLSNRAIRALGERVLGITAEREPPRFATQTFREWWRERGGPRVRDSEKRVAYFHGDYANVHTPDVGKALVSVFESLGYEVAVPDQRCSGIPMLANGRLEQARAVAEYNLDRLSPLVERGFDVVGTCPSCTLALRESYPRLFDIEGADVVAANTSDALEFLRVRGALADVEVDDAQLPSRVAYHAPCHARAQGVDRETVSLLGRRGPVDVVDLGDGCSGMSGTYGWKAERYEHSMEIGRELFEAQAAFDGDLGLTECPTCAMQMEHGGDLSVEHPIQLIDRAIPDRPE
ncbi:MAG: anaerobic glycerol-3-phosphate dehydrogenase subunit C [Halanaeroarchaeum sp.]